MPQCLSEAQGVSLLCVGCIQPSFMHPAHSNGHLWVHPPTQGIYGAGGRQTWYGGFYVDTGVALGIGAGG